MRERGRRRTQRNACRERIWGACLSGCGEEGDEITNDGKEAMQEQVVQKSSEQRVLRSLWRNQHIEKRWAEVEGQGRKERGRCSNEAELAKGAVLVGPHIRVKRWWVEKGVNDGAEWAYEK